MKRKKTGYEAIDFNQYLTRDENINLGEQIKIDRYNEEQKIKGLELINAELAQIKKDIYEGIIGNNNITKEAKKKLLDTKRAQLEKLSDQKQSITGVHPSDIGLAIVEISQLKESLENQLEIKTEARHVADEPKKATYPLELVLSGNQLLIQGYVIASYKKLTNYHTDGNGLLLVPIFKICMARPTTRMRLTKNGLTQCAQREGPEMQKKVSEVLNDPAKFRKYLSKILKWTLKKLFVARTSGGLGISFRRAVPEEEWQRLSGDAKEKIVKYLSEIPSS